MASELETFPPVPVDVTVRFAETDMMGVVHHSAYIVWFEMGRIGWMDAVGVPYTQISGAGYNFAVTEVGAQYRSAIRFGDPMQVITRLTTLRSRQVAFEYEIRHRREDVLYATGFSRHICVDDDGRSVSIPGWVSDGLRVGAQTFGNRG